MFDVKNSELKLAFSRLRDAIKKHHEAIEAHKAEVKKIEAKAGVWDAEYIRKEKTKLENNLRNVQTANMENIGSARAELMPKLAEAMNPPLNPDDTRLLNAVALVQSGVVDYEMARELNKNFVGEQRNLKALQRAYDAANVPNGGIEKLICPLSIDDIENNLSEKTYYVVYQNGHVNDLGRAVGRVAGWVGVDFDAAIKPDALSDYLRAGAGLPEE